MEESAAGLKTGFEASVSASTADDRGTGGPAGRIGLVAARRRFRLSLLAAAVLAAAGIYGLFFDQSIRPDPFSASPGFWAWLANSKPHPALSHIPVVPIGARGTLAYRPQQTAWINAPTPPDAAGQQSAEVPAAGATLRLLPQALAADVKQQGPPPVPDLVGRNADVAQKTYSWITIKIVGAKVTRAPAGTIIEQTPSAGSAIPEGGVVQVMVSGGKGEVAVSGKGQDTAQTEEPSASKEPARNPVEQLLSQPYRVPLGTVPDATMRSPVVLAADVDAAGTRCWIVGTKGLSLSSEDGGATWHQAGLNTEGLPDEMAKGMSDARDLTAINAFGPTGAAEYAAGPAPIGPKVQPVILDEQHGTSGWLFGSGQTGGLEVLALPSGSAWQISGTAPAVYRLLTLPLEGTTVGLRSGDQVWTVGSDGRAVAVQDPSAVDIGGGIAEVQNAKSTGNFNAVAVFEDRPSVAIGDRGTVMVRNGADSAWEQVETQTRANLRALHFQEDGAIGWAASGWYDSNEEGDRPVVLQTTDGGQSWERLSYRHLPPPWLLYLVLPGFVVAAYSAAAARIDVRNAPRPRASVADHAATDAPIGWEDKDALGLQPIARALSKFLRNRDTEPPLTFAVSGRWGTGKSSLLNLVAEDLREFECRPVWFNAWHHQQEQHLLAALLENIRGQAIPAWWRWSGIAFRARLAWQRSTRFLKGAVAVGAILATTAWLAHYFIEDRRVTGLIEAVKSVDLANLSVAETVVGLAGGLTALGTAGGLIYAAAMVLSRLQVITLNPAKLMASLSDHARVGDLRDQLGFRYKFQREFREVCRALRTRRNAGMVIMIDDLDRCRPQNVLDVLEAVNFLAGAGPCFIFLGIDEDKVVSSVAHEFKDTILNLPPRDADRKADAASLSPDANGLAAFARAYLEKLINITIPVPESTARTSATLLDLPPEATEAADPAAEQEESAGPVSPWPRRVRRGLATALDAAVGGGAVVVVAVALISGALNLLDLRPAEQPAEARQQQETTAAVPPTSDTTSNTASSTPLTEETATASGTTTPEAPPEAPHVSAEEISRGLPWLHGAVLVLAVLLVVYFAARRSIDRREGVVEDSVDFRDALAIWNPVIFAANPTPRGVKRYQNRLRYLAMRARGDARPPDWIDRLFRRLGHRVDGTAAEPPLAIEEPTLVALGAIDALAPDILEGDSAKTGERLNSALIGARTKRGASDGGQAPDTRAVIDAHQEISSASRFRETFPDLWPPTEDQVRTFRALTRAVRD